MKTVKTTLLLGFIISGGLQAQTMIQDTLIYDTNYDDTFNLKPGEIAICVFQMPADGEVQGFNVPIAAIDSDSSVISVSVWSFTYPFDSTGNSYDSNYVDENGWLGYYTSIDNDTIPEYYSSWPARDWNAFGDSGLCAGTELVPNNQDPLLGQYTPSGWESYTFSTTGDHWVDVEDWGYPQFQKDEYVGIFLYHHNFNGSYENITPSVAFHSSNTAEINNPYPLLVFSPSCRGISGEGGWHIRSAVLNVELAIEYVSVSTESEPELPASFALMPNYPNPFNPRTSIQISLKDMSTVDLVIYNLLGEEIIRLADSELLPAGSHNFIWRGLDRDGNRVTSGIYFYTTRIRDMSGNYVMKQTRKMIMIE
jgi:hypothetical protein